MAHDRIYRRTESGLRAWLTQDPELSAEHRKILGLIESETPLEAIRRVLRRHADQLRLADLEAEGFIVSM